MTVHDLESFPGSLNKDVYLVIGMLDGVHLGHQLLLKAAIAEAKKTDGIPAVLTFWPHPSRLFKRNNPTLMLMQPEIKNSFLEEQGIEVIIQQNFTEEFSKIEAVDFVKEMKRAIPKLKNVFVGDNFLFGHRRMGNAEFLKEEGKKLGFDVFIKKRKDFGGEPINSSRIRKALENGEIKEVNEMLGYKYFSIADIHEGNRLGREISFPTFNMVWNPECKPKYGVYAVMLERNPSVATYGMRPTLTADKEPTLEVHLLKYVNIDKTKEVKVEWLQFLRPEEKFDSKETLATQLKKDINNAKEYFNNLRH